MPSSSPWSRAGLVAVACATALATGGPAVAAAPGTPSAPLPGEEGEPEDRRPCYGPHWTTTVADGRVWRVHGRYCPDWAPDNRVPVHARPTPDSEVLDHLDVFAESWFHCQERGALTRLGPASSTWWAAAESPGRVRGWVSQVYFRGAPDDTPDGGLEFCRADDRRGMSRTVPDPVPVAVPWRHAGGR